MTGIVNYGMGNLHSVQNMLKYLGYNSQVVEDPLTIHDMDRLILPGVGCYGEAMKQIHSMNLDEALKEFALNLKRPILGICLGMQLLTEYSEEGECSGLGFIKGQTCRFSFDNDGEMKVPHMGWNNLILSKRSDLLNNIEDNDRFYFVHSYYVKCENNESSLAKTEYGIKFDSVIQNENIYGVQFHPEKSHRFGMKILSNFMEKI